MNRVETAAPGVVVKTYRSDRAWSQARRALTEFVHALPAPRLFRADRETRRVWMTHLSGAAPSPTDVEAHRRAGAWLRRLHEVPVEDVDEMGLAEAIDARVRALLRKDGGRLPRALVAELVPPRASERRVPCHRDFTPSNWLVAEDLAVVDFEHSRLDDPMGDLAKLAADVWPHAPGCRAAFAEGYGPIDEAALANWVRVHIVATWLWGLDHGDASFVALAERGWDTLGRS